MGLKFDLPEAYGRTNKRVVVTRMQNRYFMLFILSFIAVINFVDRNIIAILLNDIQQDLNLSDSQLGLLSGTLFALFYATLGVPIARLADRWHRPRLITACVACWSIMTTLSGFAANFFQLALARIGVAVGEAGVFPTSMSMISERFGAEERAAHGGA